MRPKDYEAWLEHTMKEYRKEKKKIHGSVSLFKKI